MNHCWCCVTYGTWCNINSQPVSFAMLLQCGNDMTVKQWRYELSDGDSEDKEELMNTILGKVSRFVAKVH